MTLFNPSSKRILIISYLSLTLCAEKEYKKVDKKVKHAQEAGKEQIQAALKRAIALANAEPGQSTPSLSLSHPNYRADDLRTLHSTHHRRRQRAILYGTSCSR
jgi:hypothetical protein